MGGGLVREAMMQEGEERRGEKGDTDSCCLVLVQSGEEWLLILAGSRVSASRRSRADGGVGGVGWGWYSDVIGADVACPPSEGALHDRPAAFVGGGHCPPMFTAELQT